MSNEITAYFKGRKGVAESVYQYDYGMVLVIDGIDFTNNFDCYFSTAGDDDAIPAIGADNRVAIPNDCLTRAGEVTLHIPSHTGENDSEVEFVVTFRVIGRSKPVDDGTAEEQSAVSKAIALLNHTTSDVIERIDAYLDENAAEPIYAWLDEHPEATTTVQDGAITESKLNDALKIKLLKDYVTPEMFGAFGDGTTDDTEAVRDALMYSIENGIKLLLVNTYYITESLLTSSDYSDVVVLNIEGTRPLKNYIYASDIYGGIKFANGIDVFDGVTVQGSIYRVSFMPISRTQTGSIFNKCTLRAFSFDCCSVSNILAFCHNTSIRAVSYIKNSRFLTVYYFSKCDDFGTTGYGCVDSVICNNYINGGSEMNENHCFEFNSFNGSTVANNFIDYYQTVYYPQSPVAFSFIGGISTGNQYEVFRYLYFRSSLCSAICFSSVSDCFTWMNPSTLEKLQNFVKYSYVGHDQQTHEIPPYIMYVDQTVRVSIKDALIQNNCSNLVFIRAGITSYKYSKAELTIAFASDPNLSKYDYETCVSHADAIYNAGNYKLNSISLPFILELSSLPSISFGWTDYYIGQLINVNNRIYKFVALYNTTTSSWAAEWVDVTAS